MSQDDHIPAPTSRKPRAHMNVYIDADARARLETLKVINEEWTIERIRKAVEAEIETMWRIHEAMGNGKQT
jgi:hypothetical protein